VAIYDGLTTQQNQYYDLGRQAQAGGFKMIACNVNNPVNRSWWIAGWIDADIEAGNSVLRNKVKAMIDDHKL
jgi:hypothetical protein